MYVFMGWGKGSERLALMRALWDRANYNVLQCDYME